MPQTLRFHLDEYIAAAVASGLRRRGVEVTTAADSGLLGADDTVHLAFALAQGRVVVTSDEDFLALHEAGNEHAGIAYFHQQDKTIGEVIRSLMLLWELLESVDMHNHVEFI